MSYTPSKSPTQFSNQFIIAMPTLADKHFARSVTYICDHNTEGAIGITINRPLGFDIAEVFEQMNLKTDNKKLLETPVFEGGPIQTERGFVLHSADSSWEATLQVSDQLSLTSSRDILEAIAANQGPKRFLMALGYAGWSSGQLEQEITENSWLHSPADQDLIFKTPIKKRWNKAASLIGIDVNLISRESGNA